MLENSDVSKDMLLSRLQSLREEHAHGQRLIQQKEQELQVLSQRMLRISGAIQVLEELMGGGENQSATAPSGGAPTS